MGSWATFWPASEHYPSNLCNPKEIASTLSSKASSGQREYFSNMPSTSMPVDLAHVIKNDDHASTREEEEHNSIVLFPMAIKDNVDQIGDDMVFACLVKKAGFESENNAMPYHINIICLDKSKQRATCRFLLKVSNGKNIAEDKGIVITNCMRFIVRKAVGISSGLLW